MDVPWYGYVAALAVAAWAAMVIIGAIGWSRNKSGGARTSSLIQQNVATNQAVLAKLEAIETRLAAVEKTLTDIP